ncbi:MAG: P-loop NTPase [Streptomyces sp.]|nr:P-loop NTPase [Streptomyces sp.]
MAEQRVVMVGGGKGGVGKSSVTAGLARQLTAGGRKVGVIDADLAGPSQSVLFSCGPMRAEDGVMRPAACAESVTVASIGLIAHQDTALVWSDATAAGAVQLLTAPGMWADRDVLLVDLPPGQGRVTTELAQRFPTAECLLVTTGSPLALEECVRAAAFLRRMELPVAGLIENMAFCPCAGCGAHNALFDAKDAERVAERLGVPLLARLPFDAGVAAGAGLREAAAAVATGPVTTEA